MVQEQARVITETAISLMFGFASGPDFPADEINFVASFVQVAPTPLSASFLARNILVLTVGKDRLRIVES